MVRISVLVSCHGRRNFVLEALDSVLKQDYDPGKFEIILVKNFPDDEIDRFCTDNGIMTISEDGTLGDKMAAGIEKAGGDILCFLDDDDLFLPGKLKAVDDIFTGFPEVVYVHNSPLTFGGAEFPVGDLKRKQSAHKQNKARQPEVNGPESFASLMKRKAHWYASCISVRKDLAQKHRKILREVPASYDKLWFFAALDFGGKLVFDHDSLTGYRLHDSLTTVKADSNTFLEKKGLFYSRSLEAVSAMKNKFRANSSVKSALQLENMHEKVMVSFFSPVRGGRMKGREIALYSLLSIKYRIPRNLGWSLLYIFSAVAPEIASTLFYKATIESYSV